MKYRFIQQQSEGRFVSQLCRIMKVSTSAYYAWRKRPVILITADELHLYRRTKALFVASRESLGNRELMKKLRIEGFQIGRYKTRSLMNRAERSSS